MSNKSKSAFIMSILALVFGFSAGSGMCLAQLSKAAAVSNGNNVSSDFSNQYAFKDGQAFLEGMLQAVSNWNDYECDAEFTVFRAAKNSKYAGHMSFKRDALVRLDVTGGGYRSGCIVLRRKDGKVRAQGGPMLAWVKMTVEEDSRLLLLPNGYNVIKSDLLSLVSKLAQEVKSGKQCRITTFPANNPYGNGKVYIMEIWSPDNTVLLQRLFIDPVTNVPICWDIYKDGKVFSTVFFKNLHINKGLPDQLFDL